MVLLFQPKIRLTAANSHSFRLGSAFFHPRSWLSPVLRIRLLWIHWSRELGEGGGETADKPNPGKFAGNKKKGVSFFVWCIFFGLATFLVGNFSRVRQFPLCEGGKETEWEGTFFFLVEEEVDTFGGALFFLVSLHLFQLLLPLLPLFWGVKPASPNAGFPENREWLESQLQHFPWGPKLRDKPCMGNGHFCHQGGHRSFCECPKKRGKSVTQGNFIFFLDGNLLEQKWRSCFFSIMFFFLKFGSTGFANKKSSKTKEFTILKFVLLGTWTIPKNLFLTQAGETSTNNQQIGLGNPATSTSRGGTCRPGCAWWIFTNFQVASGWLDVKSDVVSEGNPGSHMASEVARIEAEKWGSSIILDVFEGIRRFFSEIQMLCFCNKFRGAPFELQVRFITRCWSLGKRGKKYEVKKKQYPAKWPTFNFQRRHLTTCAPEQVVQIPHDLAKKKTILQSCGEHKTMQCMI